MTLKYGFGDPILSYIFRFCFCLLFPLPLFCVAKIDKKYAFLIEYKIPYKNKRLLRLYNSRYKFRYHDDVIQIRNHPIRPKMLKCPAPYTQVRTKCGQIARIGQLGISVMRSLVSLIFCPQILFPVGIKVLLTNALICPEILQL